MSKSNRRSIGDDDYGHQEAWIWGNNRGGGGAPLKDDYGNTITNLKNAVPKGPKLDNFDRKEKRVSSPQNYRRRNDPDEDDYVPSNNRDRRREPASYENSPPKKRLQPLRPVDDYDGPYSPSNKQNLSPKKFMSAIKDMHNSESNQEKSAKYMRELEYQNALKQQIEEKKRQKEEEKRKEEDLKRREYEEYLMAVNPKALEKMKQQQSDPPPKKSLRVNDGDRRQREYEVDYNEPPRNRRQRGGEEERDPPPRNRRQVDVEEDYGDARGPAGGRGRKSQLRTNDPNEEENRRVEPERGRGLRRNVEFEEVDEGGNRKGKKGERYVSPEAYDELSALCDRLLLQQEQLQDELHQQSAIIKELQKKSGGPNPTVNARDAAPVANNRNTVVPPLLANNNVRGRSKSVQQPRSNADRNHSEARREPSLAQQRPSSMHQLSNKEKAGINVSKGGEPRKIPKVAFGGSVAGKDANPPTKKKSLALQGEKALQKTPAARVNQRDNAGGGGVSGFAKLQQKVGRVGGGPMVISYEDDHDMGSSVALELRGQSKYVPVREEYDDDGPLYNDQLDRLLANNRKGKFM